ncbi:MAG: hypothetical protein RIR26_324 [Pseudomonadota bacterium]|jgi:hypothetical protein
MRHLFILPLGTLVALSSIVACSSDDSSSDKGSPAPAAQVKNDTPQQSQDGSKGTPSVQQPAPAPVQQLPIQQNPAGYFEATNGAQRYLIPSSSLIAIQFPSDVTSNPAMNINLPGSGSDLISEEKLPQVTVAVKDIQGAPVFAAGSRLIGTLKMNAPKAIFNVTGVKYGSVVYNMAAHAEVNSTKLSTKEASVTNILLGALTGTGVAFLIDGLTGDRSITWWAPLIGAAAGGLGAGFLFTHVEEVVNIKAGETAVLVPGPL